MFNTGSSTFKHLTVMQIFPRKPYRWRYTEMLSTFLSLQLQMDSTTSLQRPTRSPIAWVWIQRNSRGGLPFMLHWQTQWWPQWSRSFLPRTREPSYCAKSWPSSKKPRFRQFLQALQQPPICSCYGGTCCSRTSVFKRKSWVRWGRHLLRVLMSWVLNLKICSTGFGPSGKQIGWRAHQWPSSRSPRRLTRRLGSPSTTTVQRTVSQGQSFRAGAGRGDHNQPYPRQRKKARTAPSASSARQRWRGPGGRLCPTVEESAGHLGPPALSRTGWA